ncbi:MAG: Nitric oxide-responding transcriptional regulator Dnr (Crp/Fnr family) [uncultured Sulfurovum sp.]|uniref:Nitric oxide-responding transcriptional regulator Dnr (Crp/Fnr family) n=1 Tax=uncultured Sulfurovum sp. TaxID=269237 RepID=A0A6S6T070_9BACT|nr:MAG: Nitric oxide-responding transcriptional regulator Dnr (Crp/Fnr family) [uncultured Sulfurovum sp.]
MLLGVPNQINASTRGDVKIVEASENIRYLSQKIAKEYLYLYYNPKKINLKNKLSENMKELEKNIYQININTQSDDSKDILSFLSYTNEEIKLLLEQEATKDISILILDYSETFIEASTSIQVLHQYDFSKEEKMLMHIKELEYLLERVTKYYIASIMNLNKISNTQQMQKTLKEIEDTLKIIKAYSYPKKIKTEQEKIIKSWKIHKDFLTISSELAVPNLLSLSIKNFKDNIKILELYHKKNQ